MVWTTALRFYFEKENTCQLHWHTLNVVGLSPCLATGPVPGVPSLSAEHKMKAVGEGIFFRDIGFHFPLVCGESLFLGRGGYC